LTFTHQRYATPWGVLPTASTIVDMIARELGPEVVFRDELHHRSEHSIELAVIWLHYLLGDKHCELVPVLCGSFEEFMEEGAGPREDAQISATLDILREATRSLRSIVIAAGDLAHVGPAFGDPYPIDIVERARVRGGDEELMASVCAGDEEAVFRQVKEERDRRRICGLPPIYMTLRLMKEAVGVVTGYAQCPADQQNRSFVSICGILLS
jgi:AmmeMemoRadiSam system protein B